MICPICNSQIPDDSQSCPNCGFSFTDNEQTFVLSDNNPPEDVKLIKNKLQDYEYIGIIGEGGFSTVYKIKNKKTGDICALKILSRKLLSNPEAIKRFVREGKLYEKFSHPNIVKLFDVGSENGIPYIIMEYLEGLTLKEYIQNNAPLPLEEIVKISEEIVSVLDYLHKNGIVHRDIKPANIIINTKTKKPVLTDFGIAKDVEGSKLTATGEIIGSPYYISPEQARGEKIDGRSDIYSIGVTMYEMATGMLPFKGETPVQIIFEQVKKEELPKPSKFNEDIDPELEEIIIKAVRKDKNRRYHSAEDLLKDIRKLKKRIELGKPARKRINPFYFTVFTLLFLSFLIFYEWYDLKTEKLIIFYSGLLNKNTKKPKKIINKKNEYPTIKNKTVDKNYKLTILTDKKAEIEINGEKIGFSPPEITKELKKGTYKIKAKFIDSKEIIQKTVKIEGKPVNLLIEAPKYGVIKELIVEPRGAIFIDGKYYGKNKVTQVKLTPGKHKITAKEKNFVTQTKIINLKEDEFIPSIKITLSPIREEFRVMGIKFLPVFTGPYKYVSQKIYLSEVSPPSIKGINKLIERLSSKERVSSMKVELISENMCKNDVLKNTNSDELELCITGNGTPVLYAREGNQVTSIRNVSDSVLKSFKSKIYFKISLR